MPGAGQRSLGEEEAGSIRALGGLEELKVVGGSNWWASMTDACGGWAVSTRQLSLVGTQYSYWLDGLGLTDLI